MFEPMNRNHLSCWICSRFLSDPVIIPCGHSFCLHCIKSHWDRDRTNCSCPECDHNFPSRPALIRNTTLAEMVGESERKRKGEQSEGSPPKRPRRSGETSCRTLCWRHQKQLDVYCCTEEQIICALCAAAEHSGHRIGFVRLERSKKQFKVQTNPVNPELPLKEELRKIQTELRQNLQDQEKSIEDMKKMSEQIEEEVQLTEDACEGVIVGVIEGLQKHFLSVRKEIEAQAKAAAAQVKVSLQILQSNVEEMKEMDAELDRLLQTENSVEFLQKWPNVRSCCEETPVHPFSEGPEDPLLPFEVTKRAVKKLGRQLEEFCDKEFSSISHTPDREEQEESDEEINEEEEGREEDNTSQSSDQSGSNRIPTKNNMEPTTREEFLQYACDLSLDPRTAHKDLTISDEDKEVKCSETWNGHFIRYPERFIHRRQVLCREGLQAQRCYYEVEVEGDKAEIALTYEGIDRKSNSRSSAFGGNAKSWSLDRSNVYSVSNEHMSIQLKAPPCHKKIGVYLKFNEGTLTFYEVLDDTMIFLYKLEAEFKEPLYPGFWLGEKCSIKICDLRQ